MNDAHDNAATDLEMLRRFQTDESSEDTSGAVMTKICPVCGEEVDTDDDGCPDDHKP